MAAAVAQTVAVATAASEICIKMGGNRCHGGQWFAAATIVEMALEAKKIKCKGRLRWLKQRQRKGRQ